MARALTRTNFHSSRLLRVLADLGVVGNVASGIGFAEKLGQWLNLNDAIILRGALDASAAGISAAPFGKSVFSPGSIGDEFTRIRTTLENSIIKSTLPAAGKAVRGLPPEMVDEPMDIATAYEPHRRYYLSQQRDMDVSVRTLRSNVREALSRASPSLRKLAHLDSALEGMLGEHESKLLSTVPLLLEKRFGQLFDAHQQALVENKRSDNPSTWMHPGGWMARFRKDLESVLLAELDLRLQPTVGLMEALNNETSNHQ